MIHAPGCPCVLCREESGRVAEENLFRKIEEFESEPTHLDDRPPIPELAEEWGDRPTRVATPGAIPVEAIPEEVTPVAIAETPTARVKSFPELAHLAETSARAAETSAMGAMVDAMIENGISPSLASVVMSRAIELLGMRKEFAKKESAA